MAGLRKIDVRDYLLRSLGIETVGNANTGMLADVLAAMNYAQQTLWLAGPDYFTRSKTEILLVEGVSVYPLEGSVQSVLGPFRLASGRTLRALEGRSQVDNFGLLYLGQAYPTVDPGVPLAYWVESLFQAGDDPVSLKLHVVPAPDADEAGLATLDGVAEAASFAIGDLAATAVLPIAQQYVETLFLPIARKHLSGSTYFSAASLKEQIDAEYGTALAHLGQAGGFPPAVAPKEEREAQA